MRQCGYYFEMEENKESVFIRPIGNSRSGYPRFHAFIKIDSVSRETFVNLHLDQKKPVYEGAPAHAGEYSGEIVEKEAERIKEIIEGL